MPRLHSLIVSWRGQVLPRTLFQRRTCHPVHQHQVGLEEHHLGLVGIAIDRKVLAGVKQPIGPFFPELAAPSDAAKRAITIEDLLTMRAGLESHEQSQLRRLGAEPQLGALRLPRLLNAAGPNGVQHRQHAPALGHPDQGDQDEHMAVRAGDAGAATRIQPGAMDPRPAGDLLRRQRDGDDAEADARVRRTLPQQGPLRGQADRPGDLGRESFRPRTRSRFNDQGYGYGWWSREFAGYETYFAWGYGGQYIFVVPELDLVVVTTSSTAVGEERRSHRRTIFDLLEQTDPARPSRAWRPDTDLRRSRFIDSPTWSGIGREAQALRAAPRL